MSSWFAQRNIFAFDTQHLDLAPSARRFENGAPNMPSIYGAAPALDLLDTRGYGERRGADAAFTRAFLDGARTLGIATKTPNTSVGPLVVLRADDPAAVLAHLTERGIVVSTRMDGVRFAFHVYNDDGGRGSGVECTGRRQGPDGTRVILKPRPAGDVDPRSARAKCASRGRGQYRGRRATLAAADRRTARHDRHWRRDRNGIVPRKRARGSHRRARRHRQLSDRRRYRAAVHGRVVGMAVAHPTAGSFGVYAELYLNRWAGFTMRYTYWAAQCIAIGGEATAVAIYCRWWFPGHAGVAVDPRICHRTRGHQRAQRPQLLAVSNTGSRWSRSWPSCCSSCWDCRATTRHRPSTRDRIRELYRARRISPHRMDRRLDGHGFRDLQLHGDRGRRRHGR